MPFLSEIDLVIFDCDGVLVDSEALSARVLAKAACAEGAAMTADEAFVAFRGLRFDHCVAEIERRAGRRLSFGFTRDVRDATARVFASELRPVTGVHTALAAITAPFCVASNGPISKLEQTLDLAGLLEIFSGRIFSAYEIDSWKPDPGLFLHAAERLGANPSRCVVVEDSLAGVAAARAAGMRVLGYAGQDAGWAGALSQAGAEVFTAMARLPALLEAPHPDRPRRRRS